MRYPTFHYRWTFDFPLPPEMIWPLVSDTNRFNRDTGVPPVQRMEGTTLLENARQRLRLSRFGIPIEWEEEPFQWVRPYRFGVVRRYRRGPVAEMRIAAELEPRSDAGSFLTYEVWARPGNLFGLLAIPGQVGILNSRSFRLALERAGEAAAGVRAELPSAPVHLRSKTKLLRLSQSLVAEGGAEHLVDRLTETIEQWDDLAASHLRPYALADAWGANRREVLELCLLATRVGLLELSWELLCPLCRGAKGAVSSLGDMPSTIHCEVCRIDVTANLDRFVEVTFRPNAAIRPIDVGEYCVGGPQVTPHIVVQQLLAPCQQRSVTVPLEAGRYRLRTLSQPAGQILTVDRDGTDEVTLTVADGGWLECEPRLGERPTLHLVNHSSEEQLFILERMAWADTATPASDVIVLQRFRDLFTRESLRPNQPISVGSLAILFTDLRGSTHMYREIGDAPAFGVVMDHFDVLREAVAAEGGTVVKTVGDAIMGAFVEPAAALRAALRAQRRLRSPENGARPLFLKAGIHYGPCIAVTANDRLDYFGSTVNIAARLEGLSNGEDVVISSAVGEDTEVQELLERAPDMVHIERDRVTLKGLEHDFEIWRIAVDGTLQPDYAGSNFLRGEQGAGEYIHPG